MKHPIDLVLHRLRPMLLGFSLWSYHLAWGNIPLSPEFWRQ